MDALSAPTLTTTALVTDPSRLAGSLRAGNRSALDSVAVGFESLFTSLLIKQMRQSLEPDTLFGQDQGDILGGLFDMTLGQHLAQTGALGIGAMVKHQWAQRSGS